MTDRPELTSGMYMGEPRRRLLIERPPDETYATHFDVVEEGDLYLWDGNHQAGWYPKGSFGPCRFADDAAVPRAQAG